MLPRAATEERDDGGGYRIAVLSAEAVFQNNCVKLEKQGILLLKQLSSTIKKNQYFLKSFKTTQIWKDRLQSFSLVVSLMWLHGFYRPINWWIEQKDYFKVKILKKLRKHIQGGIVILSLSFTTVYSRRIVKTRQNKFSLQILHSFPNI